MVLLKNNRGSRIVLYICMGLLSLFLAVTILPAFYRTDSDVILFKNSSLSFPSMLIGVFFLIILLAFLFRRIDRLSPAGDKWLKISLFFAFLLLEIVMIASFQTVLKSDSWKINDLTIYSAINGSLDPTVNDTFSSYFSVYSNNNLFTYILYFFYSALVQIGITSAKSLIFCGVLLNLQTLL